MPDWLLCLLFRCLNRWGKRKQFHIPAKKDKMIVGKKGVEKLNFVTFYNFSY